MISFDTTKEEQRLILAIVKRGTDRLRWLRIDYPGLDMQMDLKACHANGCPLRFADLLAADDFNFPHDLLGIREHLNRETGRLEGFFLPRFAA